MIDSPLNHDNDDNSNDMIDIRIEESLIQESLMKIDASNFKEDIKLFIIYLGVILFSFILGFTNLHRYNKEQINHPFQSNTIVNYRKSDLSSTNSFISFFIYFSDQNDTDNIDVQVNLTYDAACYLKNTLIHKSKEQINNLLLHSSYSTTYTHPFNFYFDQIIDYTRINVDIKLITQNNGYKNVTLLVYYGDQTVNLIVIMIKCIFTLIHLLLLIKVVIKLKSESVRYWHLEQKLTIPLVFISMFYNNPFELIRLFSPSYALLIYNCIITSIFYGYFELFVLALFDSLRFKNRKIKKCFFTPKITFILILFFSSLINKIYITINSFDTSPSLRQDKVYSALSFINLILYLLYYVWFMVSVVLAGFQVDVTERYKFNVYFVSCFASLILLALSNLLHLFDFFDNKTLNVFVPIATINMFVILMLFFHYPYEVIDGRIDNNENQNNNEQENKNNQNIFIDPSAQIEAIN